MKRSQGLFILGLAAVAGSAAAALMDRRHPVRAGLIGAAAGMAAGVFGAGLYNRVRAGDDVPYFSSSSPLYADQETL